MFGNATTTVDVVAVAVLSLLLMAMVLVDLTRNGPVRGFFLGLAIAVRPSLVPFLGLLLITKQWTALRNALGGIAAVVLAGVALEPAALRAVWVEAASGANATDAVSNQSVLGFLVRLGGDPLSWQPLWLLLAATITSSVLWVARRMWLADDRLASVAVCGTGCVAAAAVSWPSHWMWIFPLGVSLIRAVRRRWGTTTAIGTGIVWYGAFLLTPIAWPRANGGWQMVAANSYLLTALGGLTLLLVATLPRRRLYPETVQPANKSSRPPTV